MSGQAGPSAELTNRDFVIAPSADGLARVRFRIQEWVDSGLDWLFPPKCIHCQRKGTLWCSVCRQAIEIPPDPVPQDIPPALNGRRATALFGGSIQSAIHALKYKNNRRMAVPLAARLAVTLRSAGWSPTLLTAVPLHPDRLRDRGYNQSALLAARLSAATGIPFQGNAVRRVKNTQSQVGLNFQDRQVNVAEAFVADKTIVAGGSIVVIDDVYTTGATLCACAEALRAAGAEHVWALTIASATYHDSDRSV
jgi:ComF family protein